jgi:hypothetical protein
MSCFRLSLLVLSLPTILFAIAVRSPNVVAQDHVNVQPRRVAVLRSGKEVRDFPERRKAIVRYPILRGLSDAAVLRRIQTALGINTALKEFRENPGLLQFDYKVNYNKNYLFDITITEEAEGAYPEMNSKHFLFSLKTGRTIKAADAFDAASLAGLAGMADQKLKDEIKELLQINEEGTSDADQKSDIRDQLNSLAFGVEHLNDFMVSDNGVTFLYNARFRHAIRALQPNGEYFFSHAELRRYIKSSGPLGVFTVKG